MIMKLFRLELKIISPPGTPWQSDTLFGHICWQIVQREGESALNTFLEPFIRGEPPFVLSDGFPQGCLPVPLPKPFEGDVKDLDEYQERKKAKKLKYCLKEDFLSLREGKADIITLLGKYHKSPIPDWKREEMLHASIDRNTGTTSGEGNLFSSEVIYTDDSAGANIIDIYLLCQPEWEQRAIELVEMVAETGYGKDKSVGSGHFALDEYFEADDLLQLDNPSGFVTLSSYVPGVEDPVEGRWKLRAKYGKLSEGAGNGNPFKRPLIQIEPGAVFACSKFNPYYGTMVQNIAPGMPRAVQCGYTIALPMRC